MNFDTDPIWLLLLYLLFASIWTVYCTFKLYCIFSMLFPYTYWYISLFISFIITRTINKIIISLYTYI